jgi:hypothetical protein
MASQSPPRASASPASDEECIREFERKLAVALHRILTKKAANADREAAPLPEAPDENHS